MKGLLENQEHSSMMIREVVKKTGLRKGAVANELGIPASTFSTWLQGKRRWRLGEAICLADALERLTGRYYPVDDLIGRMK